jgi:hypothetical protein
MLAVNPAWHLANLDDESALARLSDGIREWDPGFELYRPRPDALLYEPDGTLFAVALSPMTAECHRRLREVRPGDLLVVPAGLAVGVEPTVDLLGLRFGGEPPDHFRERFIQVWGYDLLRAEDDCEVVAAADLRFPLSYSVRRLDESPSTLPSPSALGRRLLIALEGRFVVEGRGPASLAPRDVLMVEGDDAPVVRGPGRLGVLDIEPDLLFAARRADARRAGTQPTPEHLPPSPQSSGS